MLAEQVWQRLAEVEDPCSAQLGRPMNLVSMGLVGSVKVDEERIDIRLVLTEPGCVFFFSFMQEIEDRVRPIAGGRSIDVSLDDEEMWTPERLGSSSQRRGGAHVGQ